MGLSWFREATDRRDERRAQRLQADYGRRGWLLSWCRAGDGLWRASLSSPQWPRTTVARGRTRREAIDRADLALRLVLGRYYGRPSRGRDMHDE
jgi:hypothetical protein